MNIIITKDENYLNDGIKIVCEVFENTPNPSISFRKDESGKIGIHLSNWSSPESVDIYDDNSVLELLEALHTANDLLKQIKTDMINDQGKLFEENENVREN